MQKLKKELQTYGRNLILVATYFSISTKVCPFTPETFIKWKTFIPQKENFSKMSNFQVPCVAIRKLLFKRLYYSYISKGLVDA